MADERPERDPDRLRDEVANGDRPAPPGWPGRIGIANAPRPSNRDVSAGGEPSPEAGPKAEASHAGTGTGMPSDCEGLHREGEGSRTDTGAANGEPSPDVRAA